MLRNLLWVLAITVMVFVQFSCNQNRLDTDLKSIDLDLKVKRFEKDLFGISFDSISTDVSEVRKNYPDFFPLFNRIIRIGDFNTPTYNEMLLEFLTYYEVQQAYGKVQEEFPDITDLEEDFTEAFKRYKYFFPNKVVPHVVTYVGGFQQSVVVADSLLAIGLDNYLGKDCEFYKRLGIQQYVVNKMRADMIVPDCINAWLGTEFLFNDSVNNVLSHMIHAGKILYASKQLLPHVPDSLILGFTSSEMGFCENNEKEMWTFLVEYKRLFSSDQMTINKLINDAPFTHDFSTESPGRATTWIGLRIVESFMRHNKLSLQALMEDNDYMYILNNAKYIP